MPVNELGERKDRAGQGCFLAFRDEKEMALARNWSAIGAPAAASRRISVRQFDNHPFTYHHLDLPECLPEQAATIMSQTQVVQTDSMEDDDPHSASEKKQKTRRPASAQDLCTIHYFAEKNI
jgi:hypothetical protein